jgi:hypothetical protein
MTLRPVRQRAVSSWRFPCVFSQGTGLRNCGGTKEMWRQPSPDSKSPRRFPRAGINRCDDEDMRLICPTCQISCDRRFTSARLFEPLNRRRGCCARNCFRNFLRRRRTHLSGRLLPRCRARLCRTPRARCGPSNSPGVRNRRSCGISDQRTRHGAHGSQHDSSRHRPQGRISAAILRPCFERSE